MSVTSVLTGEVLDARRPGEPSHAKTAVGIAGVAHAVALIALIWGLGRVPTVPEGPVGFEPLTLVFEVRAGPGGGGGGGGDGSPEPPTIRKAEEGESVIAPVAVPAPRETLSFTHEPAVVEKTEPSIRVEAPLLPTAPDDASREGLLEAAGTSTESRGPGEGGGVGSGTGTGIGPGEGAGLGEGQGGGFGGGAYRLGSGVEPPILKRRVEPRYTSDALHRKLEGEVVLEIIILSDGTVGPVRVTKGLDPTLDRNAIDAVRQWRFVPGKFRDLPVDVVAEVVVAFRLF